jgi:hypothetical protein
MFMFIRNKTKILNKFIEVVVYKFKVLLYPEGILF